MKSRFLVSFRPLLVSLLLALSMRGFAQAARATATSPAPPTHQVVGYFPQWGVYNRRYVPKDLITRGAVKTLTQIDYAQANIRDNSCVVADPQADTNLVFQAADSIDAQADQPTAPLRGNFHQLQLLRARYPKLRVLISIMGKRSQFEDAAKPENRVAFAKSCVAMFLQGHIAPGIEAPRLFDGIDVDWEYPDQDHAEDFIALLQEFRKQMDALRPGLTLSIASGASGKNVSSVDWHRASAPLDQINVMTYDYQGPWSHITGFNAPLRSANLNEETVSTTIDGYLQAGVPAQKLLLGIPFYAYQWQNVPETGTHGLNAKGDPVRGNLNQSTAITMLANPAAKLYRDPVSLSPWVYDGNNFLTFDDPASLQAKTAYADEKKLGGVMIWELSGDTTEGILLRALAR
ncbi:glycoside hydrolase family 18 protein [Terriglobus sp.]|uniref:glycoside hydrolase family 18 protein n=1 Tax=Terriglobus sp. TaxID=1889013 RepID=UPI003B00FBCA